MKYLILFFVLINTCFAAYKPYTLNTTVKGISLVSAYITNSGACAISSQDGNWIQSVSHPATGTCNLDITGYFSAAPYCIMKCVTPGHLAMMVSRSTTNITIACGNKPLIDSHMYIICYGAK